MAGVARRLRGRGAVVGWLALPEASAQIRSLADEVEEPLAGFPRPALPTGGQELAGLVRDRERLRAWLRTLLVEGVEERLGPLREAIRRFRPDAVATDPMQYGVVLAAHLEGVRFCGISSSLNPVTPEDLPADHLANVRSHAAERDALFQRHGLAPRFRVCDFLAPTFTAVFATRAYVGDVEVPDRVALVGPSSPGGRRGDELPFPWERVVGGRPLVYVSFGSQIWYQPEVFRRVAAAAEPLGATVALNAGELASDPWPPHVVAVPYAPQLELLSRADLLVSHGGANSVMEALSAGVPVLASPVCNDQPLQAWFLARSGAGRVLDLATSGVEEVRAALAALLAPDAPERSRAREVAAAYRGRDGAAEAARLVLALAEGRA
ncbi:glycosyltransferase family 1 protein [Acidobacteria bacterium ACD]|nr:MAG: glycosyltransferase [Acidobacteriota bacterium]MDL1950200.1 glycosyltransferase family 1 protein [Acidobacteria bacterium ACD]